MTCVFFLPSLNPNDSDLGWKTIVLRLVALNGGGKSIELVQLISTGGALLRSTAGGGKHCAAERPLLGARFIHQGGARRGIVEL
jgi:hypothetical protein